MRDEIDTNAQIKNRPSACRDDECEAEEYRKRCNAPAE